VKESVKEEDRRQGSLRSVEASRRTPKMMERLQKIMAGRGIASRRKAEEMIAAGRVTLNGIVVTEQGTKADPERDEICVDGQRLRKAQRLVYFLLNKPKGYVTTVSDPAGRPTVMDLLPRSVGRVYPVGRLDYASEGLLLMTNDGALAQKLMKAGSHVPKRYWVKVSGKPGEKAIAKLRRGITIVLEDGRRVKTSPAKIRLVEDGAKESGLSASLGTNEWPLEARGKQGASGERANPWYEVTLIEGRNRQIRRMFGRVGHHVEKIKRVQLGPLVLDVEAGKFRELTEREVMELKKVAGGGREGKGQEQAKWA
jgi:23S rRNA pseudouridine2605 synthase